MVSTIRLKRNGKISGIKIIISITHITKRRETQDKSINFSNSNIPNMISIVVIIVDLVVVSFSITKIRQLFGLCKFLGGFFTKKIIIFLWNAIKKKMKSSDVG